ncbi:MAG: diguanylate cyclase domain-containing protein [Devosia sp.]
MTRLHTNSIGYLPVDGSSVSRDPVLDGLARLRVLLGVDSVSLSRIANDDVELVAASGSVQNHAALAAWQARAVQADEPLIVADIAEAGTAQAGLRFFAGIMLATGNDAIQLLLSLGDSRPRSTGMAYRLAALAIDVTSRATIARQARQIEKHQASVRLPHALFERASTIAKIGLWTCDLADQSLTWTDSVYDLFELPRGSVLHRETTADRYTPASRIIMEEARSKAIADGSDFSVDAEIITAKGARRWMRLTGSIETRDGVATRIFGMKQDITEEKLLADRTRYLAETDIVTGLANRSQFQSRIADLSGAEHGTPVSGLLLVDLDGFKQINDNYGHALGDDCLKESAARLTQCCKETALVARIGGDEFAVLPGSVHSLAELEALADEIVRTVGRPFIREGQHISLTASVGFAQYRGGTSEELFRNADLALYAAKAAGRNTSRQYAR